MHCYEFLFLVAVAVSLLVTGIITIDGVATCYDSTLNNKQCHNPPFLSYGSPFLYNLGASVLAVAIWLCLRRLYTRRRQVHSERRQGRAPVAENVELGLVRVPRVPPPAARARRARPRTNHRVVAAVERESFSCRGDSVEEVVEMYENDSATRTLGHKTPSIITAYDFGK